MESNTALQSYQDSLDELLVCLHSIRYKWLEYQNILDSDSLSNLAYRVPVVHTGRRGRPRFDITKEQLEYLASLSFTWMEITALIGVSRTTIFRYAHTVR